MAIALSDGYVQTALGTSNDGGELLSCCHVLWGHETPISSVALNNALDVSVSGDVAGKLCVHTLRRGEFVRFFHPMPIEGAQTAGSVQKLALHNCGNLAVHMEDQGLHLYTINGVRLSSVDAGDTLHDMIFTSDGERLITGGDQCQVLIRNTRDLRVVSSLDLGRHGPVRCLSLTPDDLNPIVQYLFVGSDDGMITVVDEDHSNDSKDAVDL